MDLQLAGKTALVTGASRGIGLAITRALTAEGVRVSGAARTITPKLQEVAAHTVAADLSTSEGTQIAVTGALTELGGLDILVNSVGAGDAELRLGGFLETGENQWRQLFDLNLFSAMSTTLGALPSLLERGGVIVNISSINSRVPAPGPVGYSEAKAALTAFSKRLSEEFRPRGVRVNTVSPGAVGTGLWRDPDRLGARVAAAQGLEHREFLEVLPQQFGMASPRITEPEEVAALVTFLASSAAGNITGSDVIIDGGTIKTT